MCTRAVRSRSTLEPIVLHLQLIDKGRVGRRMKEFSFYIVIDKIEKVRALGDTWMRYFFGDATMEANQYPENLKHGARKLFWTENIYETGLEDGDTVVYMNERLI